MAELNKRQYKDLDKKISEIRDWMDKEKETLSERNFINNFSFMMNMLEKYHTALENQKMQMGQMQEGLTENFELVEEFLDTHEQREDWDAFLSNKREEAQKKFDEENDPNYKIKQELADAEAEAEEGGDDKTED